MLSEEKVKQIKKYLKNVSPESKVYIGCDSKRYKRKLNKAQSEWYAAYHTAVVIHKDNRFGCKVFVDTEVQRDYDQRKDRPVLRMMNEAYKAVEAYQQLEDLLIDRDVEVHLDINEDDRYGSASARGQAVGYCKGVTGRVVRIKPDAFAASYAADHQTKWNPFDSKSFDMEGARD